MSNARDTSLPTPCLFVNFWLDFITFTCTWRCRYPIKSWQISRVCIWVWKWVCR